MQQVAVREMPSLETERYEGTCQKIQDSVQFLETLVEAGEVINFNFTREFLDLENVDVSAAEVEKKF